MRVNMPTPHLIDDHRGHLHRIGWSLGEFCTGNTWTVEACRGEVRIQATDRLATEPAEPAWCLSLQTEMQAS
jgi:hypothetical protein